jgi:hypothetical protein
MLNHPNLRLHQLRAHGFADYEAVLICAFAAPPIGYRRHDNSIRFFFNIPSIRAGSYVACILVDDQSNEIKTLWVIATERAQGTWTLFSPRELFLILAPCAIN